MTLIEVRIEVHTGVSLGLPAGFTVELTTGDGRTVIGHHSGPDVLIDEMVLDVVRGRLLLGEEDFGTVTPEDVVQITSQGVLVNGAPRSGEDT